MCQNYDTKLYRFNHWKEYSRYFHETQQYRIVIFVKMGKHDVARLRECISLERGVSHFFCDLLHSNVSKPGLLLREKKEMHCEALQDFLNAYFWRYKRIHLIISDEREGNVLCFRHIRRHHRQLLSKRFRQRASNWLLPMDLVNHKRSIAVHPLAVS